MLHKSKLAFWQATQGAGSFPGATLAYDFTKQSLPFVGQAIPMTRSTIGTYYNSSGIRVTAAINEPRFDYNPATLQPRGYLKEKQATNIILQSNNFSNASWLKTDTTVTASDTTGVDGLMSGSLVTEGITGGALIYQDATIVAGSVCTFQVCMKRGNHDFVQIIVGGPGLANGFRLWVNLATGVISNAGLTGTGTYIKSRIVALPNGWYFIEATGTVAPADTLVRPTILSAVVSGSSTRVSNGTRYQTSAQLEVGGCATSYIDTTTSQVTRASDFATRSIVASEYNQDEGTFYAECETFDSVAAPNSVSIFCVDDNVGNNRMLSRLVTGTNNTSFVVTVGAVAQAILEKVPTNAFQVYKSAYSYKTDNIAFTRDGTTVLTDSSASVPSGLITNIRLGGDLPSSPTSNIWLRKFAYWPYQRSNTDLVSITS